jgi:hypothetical protein
MHVYTMKKNAVRAAKKGGLTADAVKAVDGGFVVQAKAAKAVKARKVKGERAKADYPREGTKNAKLLDMLTRDGGATAAQLEAALGWKQPTIRTAIQRVTRAYGLEWRHVKGQDGAKSRWEASRAA